MSDQILQQNISISSKSAVTTTTPSYNATQSPQRVVQNFLLIWMDAGIDQSNKDCQNTLTQLRNVVHDVHIFTQRDQCIDFLTEIDDIKACLITGRTLGQQILPLVHDIPQLDAVYIFCNNKSNHEKWSKTWVKVKGVHTDITPILESLQQSVKQFNQDSIAVSFLPLSDGTTKQNLDQLEPSFMYTQIFKEILLEMEDNQQSLNDFILFWRHHYVSNTIQLNVIAEFERDYWSESSIWWYTREYFLYQMLNRALRTLEADTIIKMGFFIRHLHRQIEQLHKQQVGDHHRQPFTVYRGQGLSTKDFEKLLKTKGGLMSFNNFLSTSSDEQISLAFAEGTSTTDMIGILFKIFVDPSIPSVPFAAIQKVSYFQAEEEILFSMHTVFRIGDIKSMDDNHRGFQVDLILTGDNDKDLRVLTDRIREETLPNDNGLYRLGIVLCKIGRFQEAQQVYEVMQEQNTDEAEEGYICCEIGSVKYAQGEYEDAIKFYKKSLKIYNRSLPPNHLNWAISYNNIGIVYYNMGDYPKALLSYERAHEIQQQSLPTNHPDLAASYNNIGVMYNKIGEYSKALSSYDKALKISQQSLPSNHPQLADSCNSIGVVYNNMGEYSKALSSYEKALEIKQQFFPPIHPELGDSYNNIGSVYNDIGEYSKALSSHEKALEIRQQSLPPNHPELGASYNNIGNVYYNMSDHTKARSYYERAVENGERSLPPNHPILQKRRSNLDIVKRKL
jgi:tetratricopeptide (TPR) repeat protein